MSGLQFIQKDASAGYLRYGYAMLANGDMLTVQADANKDRIEVARYGDMQTCSLVVTAEQARILAAELVACADAQDAATREGKQ